MFYPLKIELFKEIIKLHQIVKEKGTFQYTTRRKEGRDKYELDNGNGWFTGRADFGYAYFVNGDRYVGGWSNGKMEGEGTYFYRAGDKYEGTFSNGRKEGSGSFAFGDLREYKGEFTADKLEGQGRMTFPEGHVYEGRFADWKKSGHGTMTRRNGDVYVGVWDDESGVGRVSVSDFNVIYEVWADIESKEVSFCPYHFTLALGSSL